MSDSLQTHGLEPTRLPCKWGFSRQEYWSGLPCPLLGDLPNPGIEPVSLICPALASRFFNTSVTWEAQLTYNQPGKWTGKQLTPCCVASSSWSELFFLSLMKIGSDQEWRDSTRAAGGGTVFCPLPGPLLEHRGETHHLPIIEATWKQEFSGYWENLGHLLFHCESSP